MSEPTQDQPKLLDITSETFVIALELADAELRKTPARIVTALQSSDVQKAITKVINEFARKRLSASTTQLSEQDAKALGEQLREAGQEAILENVTTQIKNTAKYKALDASLQALGNAFKQSPMGVWLDENSTLVYIVGVGAVLGGAAAMYVTRTGDPVTKTIFPLVGGKSVNFKLMGSLKLEAGVEKIVFKPSERLIEAKTFVTGKWKQIEAKVNLSVTAANEKVTAEASGKVMIPLAKGISLVPGLGGGYSTANKNYSLNLSLGLDVKGLVQLGVVAGFGKGGIGPLPDSPAYKAMPEPPRDNSRPGWFMGLGASASF